MSQFLDAAHRVLQEEGQPLSAKEITSKALKNRFLDTQGKTPWQTMKSKLSISILHEKERSAFMRTDQARFALRVWKQDGQKEYVADRFKKALLKEQVVVFPTASLSKYLARSGFHEIVLENGRDLLNECVPMERLEAEQDSSVIQLVSVFLISHRGRLLTYKRTKRLPEQRLHGYYSLIFGGHITYDELPSLFDIFNPRDGAWILRELEEEVRFDIFPNISYKGLLYDDSRALSRQHLGIVYDVLAETSGFKIGERGFLIDAKWETIEEIRERREQFENWSTLILEHEHAASIVTPETVS